MVDAVEINVPDFQPENQLPGFPVEVVDESENPVKEVEFNYIVDGAYSKTGSTDENGILNVIPIPKNNVAISLGEQIESPPKTEE